MAREDFIFIPSTWLGEGKISFSHSSEFIKFYTRWNITEDRPGLMKAVQVVEMHGIEEQVVNTFLFSNIKQDAFAVLLENALVEKISGTGVRDENVIAWEFRGQLAMEGFEVYERQDNGDYFFHAEYGSPESYRTIVEGLIWRKGES